MSLFKHYYPEIQELVISPDEVLDIMQQEDRSPENPVVTETIEVLEMLPDIVEMRGGYAVYDDVEVMNKEGKIRIHDRYITTGKKVAGYMKEAEKIAVFIASAGERFTSLTEQFNKEGEYLKSYITDTFGSILAEKTIDFVQQNMENDVRDTGMFLSNRYSPGYCNWDITDQKYLFDLLPANDCSIDLTNSCLMLPIKSVSGIIGIGTRMKKKSYACDICEYVTCIYRKVRNKKKM